MLLEQDWESAMYEYEVEDPICHDTGICVAPKGAREITNCVHCGKELHEKDGKWWTWDADNFSNPLPQGYVL